MDKTVTKKLSINTQNEILNNLGKDFLFSNYLKTAKQYPLKPTKLEILQINLGYLCNMECNHCHVDASPRRKEVTAKNVLEKCLEVIDSTDSIHTVDLTGGAPEMNPHFTWLIKALSQRNVEILVRSNLTILVEGKFKSYPEFLKNHKVTIVSSLPCYTEQNVDAQRGDGTFQKSIKALKILNNLGYGKSDDLKLHLVYNPGGASVAGNQQALQNDYKKELKRQFDIEFNELYTITNLPISRFLEDLLTQNKLQTYIELLANSFNPNAAQNVMCKNTLSVDYNGNLYDCDFNQILKLPFASNIKNIMDFDNQVLLNRTIVTSQHCFGCTAGEGSSCQGALT
ncbi:MAG TPA: radical SAM/Cys-rich domain protein [Crocinitomix sp.]|nr:radical SAM/Cys-rich domain protein [Crocinitomix sp.]